VMSAQALKRADAVALTARVQKHIVHLKSELGV